MTGKPVVRSSTEDRACPRCGFHDGTHTVACMAQGARSSIEDRTTPEPRVFPTEVVLSAYTGVLYCHGMGPLYDFIEYMTGAPVMTHQLPAMCDALMPVLEVQHPMLRVMTLQSTSLVGKQNWLRRVIEQTFGPWLACVPAPEVRAEAVAAATEFVLAAAYRKES